MTLHEPLGSYPADAGAEVTEPSFDERLRAATERAKPPAPSPRSAADGSALAVGMRVVVELLAAMVVGLAIGWALDRWLGTRPWMLIVFVFAGGAAGIANVWRMLAPPRLR